MEEEKQEAGERRIWTRAPRSMPWHAQLDNIGHLQAKREVEACRKLMDTLQDEEKEWTGGINDREKVKSQCLAGLERRPLSEAVPEGVTLLPCLHGGEVILWRNPEVHPCPHVKGLVFGWLTPEEAAVYEKQGKGEVLREGEMEYSPSHVLCVNHSGIGINEFIEQAEILAKGEHEGAKGYPRNGVEDHYYYSMQDPWGTPVPVKLNYNGHSRIMWNYVSFSGTFGDEGDRLRTLAYVSKDVMFLCFHIARPWSFDKVRNKFAIETVVYSPNLVLVGLGAELRGVEDPSVLAGYITVEEGIHLAKTIRAAFYIECSEMTGHGVIQAFQEVSFLMSCHKHGLNKKKNEKRKKGGKERCLVQ